MSVTEKEIEKIMKQMSDMMGVDITMLADQSDQGKIEVHFDINAILSKIYGLFIYCGWAVRAFGPDYNSVHANVEWWKKSFSELEAKAVIDANALPPSPPIETPAPETTPASPTEAPPHVDSKPE